MVDSDIQHHVAVQDISLGGKFHVPQYLSFIFSVEGVQSL